MANFEVVRQIPEQFIRGINSGKYMVHGGTVRQATGSLHGGEIVGHLQFNNPDAMLQMGQFLQPLMSATVALSAINLAVSVAGFAIVCNKLNNINQKLDDISAKIDRILKGIESLDWTQEMERRARWEANIENTVIAMRTDNRDLANIGLAALNASQKFYQNVSSALVRDPKQCYFESLTVSGTIEMALAAAMVRAQGFALLGNIDVSIDILEKTHQWQSECLNQLEIPIKMTEEEVPLWLLKLSREQRRNCRELIVRERQVPEGIAYLRNQYEFCQKFDLEPAELARLVEDEPFALLRPSVN